MPLYGYLSVGEVSSF